MFKPIGYICKDINTGEAFFLPTHMMKKQYLAEGAEPVFFNRFFKFMTKFFGTGIPKKRPKLNKTASNITTSGSEW